MYRTHPQTLFFVVLRWYDYGCVDGQHFFPFHKFFLMSPRLHCAFAPLLRAFLIFLCNYWCRPFIPPCYLLIAFDSIWPWKNYCYLKNSENKLNKCVKITLKHASNVWCCDSLWICAVISSRVLLNLQYWSYYYYLFFIQIPYTMEIMYRLNFEWKFTRNLLLQNDQSIVSVVWLGLYVEFNIFRSSSDFV